MQYILFDIKNFKANSVRRNRSSLWFIFFLPLSCLFFQASAQDSENVYIEISQCLPLQTNPQRLACFEAATERVIGKLDELPSIQNEILPDISLTIDKPESDIENINRASTDDISDDLENFGNNSPEARIIENENNGNEELIDHITALQEREPGKYLITLASGQVWYQMFSKRYRLRKDMEIKIYPSPFGGSYRLSSPRLTGYIQVKRVE